MPVAASTSVQVMTPGDAADALDLVSQLLPFHRETSVPHAAVP
jgi:hypothetical protein